MINFDKKIFIPNVGYIIITILHMLIFKILGQIYNNVYFYMGMLNIMFPILWIYVENFNFGKYHLILCVTNLIQTCILNFGLYNIDVTRYTLYRGLGISFLNILYKKSDELQILGDVILWYCAIILLQWNISIFLLIFSSFLYSYELYLFEKHIDNKYFTSAITYTSSFLFLFPITFFYMPSIAEIYQLQSNWFIPLIAILLLLQLFIQLLWTYLLTISTGMIILIISQIRRILVLIIDMLIFHNEVRVDIFMLFSISSFCHICAIILS